jgi:hypothetical protein
MKQTLFTFLMLAQALLFGYQLPAQGIDLQLKAERDCDNGTYCVTLSIQGKTGSDPFEIGASALLLQYNPGAVAFQSYTPGRFDGSDNCGTSGSSSAWEAHQYDAYSHPGLFNLVLFLSENDNSCPTILDTEPIAIGTLCFDILQQGGNPDIRFEPQHTHFNKNNPNDGTAAIPVSAFGSIDAADVLACDCPGAGVPCDDQNVYTTNDQYDTYCNCNGELIDTDQDGIVDGIDACLDLTYEAEDATHSGLTFLNNRPQYYGLGFMGFEANNNDFVEFQVTPQTTGDYTLTLRYTSDGTTRSLELMIDGTIVDPAFSLPETDTWNDWAEVTLAYTFEGGPHTIRLTNNNNYGPNIDRLTVSICNGCDLAGSFCDDGNPCTTDDVYDSDCNCGGRIVDADNDQVPDACDSHIGTAADMPLETGLLKGVGEAWQTVTLEETYESMVVVATPHLAHQDMLPVVTRIRNAVGNSFEVRVQNPGGTTDALYNVYYVVVEEGVYQAEYDGITMEARREYAEVTADHQNWNQREERTYRQNYQLPVVLGQVMTDYDPAWSVFWAASAENYQAPADGQGFIAGKHKGEDNSERGEEEIGIIVMESGQYVVRDKWLEAAVGPATVGGMNATGHTYTLGNTHITGAVLTGAGMQGGNGYWPVLFGPSPVANATMTMVSDEDQMLDEERSHAQEHIAYLAFEAPICLEDADNDTVCDAQDICPGSDDLADVDNDGIPDGCDDCNDNLIGRPCDDGNECTILDTYVEGCGCFGIPMDSDGDGVCNWDDQCEGSDDTIDADGDGLPDGCDPNVGDAATMPLETGKISGVGDQWQVITLSNSYTSMVVVATPHLISDDAPPVVTRIRNASGNSFELKVQNPSGPIAEVYDVYYFVVEEGMYTAEHDGVTMEARKVASNLTAGVGLFGQRESREYLQPYTNPVVLGQVMTANDDRWSVFWASLSNSQASPPDAERLAAGKHIGADTITDRAVETLSLVIIESGSYFLRNTDFEARVGDDTVLGVTVDEGFTYPLDLEDPEGAVLSAAGMDGGDGYWPVLFTDQPFGINQIKLAVDEDQIADSERSHTDEQVAYLAFTPRGTCDLALFASTTDESCAGAGDGRASIGYSGANGEVDILWSTGAISASIDQLTAGTYSVTVTDEAACTLSQSITIDAPPALEGLVATSQTSCFGEADGTAAITLSGGTAPYQYEWSTGDITHSLTGLPAGDYGLTVTDASNCLFVIDDIQVLQPAELLVDANILASSGDNGAIDITVTGGTPNYTYFWNSPEWYGVETTPDLSGLSPGAYHLTVTDANGCSFSESFNIFPEDLCTERVYQAEDAELNGPVVITSFPGYTGDGFLRMGFTTGESLTFNVDVAEDGMYLGQLRYALKWNNNRPMELVIDGQIVDTLWFANTASWSNWQLQEFEVPLMAGTHTIRFHTYTTINAWHHPWIDMLGLCLQSGSMAADAAIDQDLIQLSRIDPIQQVVDQKQDTPLSTATDPGPDLLLSPNPTRDQIMVEATVKAGHQRQLIVTDVNGKVVLTRILLNGDDPWIRHQLNVGDLANGIYFVHLMVDGERQTGRFVKN